MHLIVPSPRDRPVKISALSLLVLYLAVLSANPLLHHDFACHQRTPGHCQACRANPPAPRAAESLVVAAVPLAEVGSIEAALERWAPRHVPISSPGRSPPA